MTPVEPNRTARLEARITPDALAIVRRAAELQGRSVSDFVVAAAQEAASRTIEETQLIRLSIEDSNALSNCCLIRPRQTLRCCGRPKPTSALPWELSDRTVPD
jgi:uncharacterized protein (DUF1778 family)